MDTFGSILVTISAEVPCPGDINEDGTINVLDLIDLLLAFGMSCP